MKRPWIIYAGVFGTAILVFLLLIRSASNPERLILGEWEELTWKYEAEKTLEADTTFTSGEEHLVVHKAEKWHFLPQGRLKLTCDNKEQIITWRIKGRGEILQLKYNNGTTEHYLLGELNENAMHLNFDSDIQARGIATLTFKKIKK